MPAAAVVCRCRYGIKSTNAGRQLATLFYGFSSLSLKNGKKMKNLFFIAVMSSILSAGCSKLDVAGVSSTKYMNIDESYTGIIVDGPMTVEVSSAYDMVKLTSDSNVLPYIEIFTDGDNLVVKYKDGSRFSGKYETEIGLPFRQGVNRITLSGTAVYRQTEHVNYQSIAQFDVTDASVLGFGSIKAGEVVLNLSGASAFYADLAYVDDMTVTARDASYAGIDGDIRKCTMTLENASRFSRISESRNNALQITTLDCFLYNSSSATLYSDGYVNGTLDGASSITLSGDADCSSVICNGNSSVIRQ